jgi:rRNA processing protein Krr1/Pno1
MDEIRQVSGARVDIPKAARDQDPATRVEILIKGTKAQAIQAKKMIEEKRAIYDSTVVKSVEVDKKHHRALIGAGGSALRDIVVNAGGSDDKRELAKTVQFPKADADGNTIKVTGKEDLVDKIIASIQQIVIDRDNQTTETIDVPTDKHRSLIGRGGETKKELEAKFKVSIDIPRQGSEDSAIKITGLAKDVGAAKSHIQELTKEQAGETIQVPRKVHHSVSDNGQFFRKLRNDHQVTVDHAGSKLPPKPSASEPAWSNVTDLPLITDEDTSDAHAFRTASLSGISDDGEIPWVLRGSPESIAKAKATLAAAIEQALKNDTLGHLTLPDPSTYRYVIGQGGSKVNSIRKATGCKITVPRDQAAGQPIEIIGSYDGVEKARQLILKAVKEGIANGGNRGTNGRFGGAANGNGNGNWD